MWTPPISESGALTQCWNWGKWDTRTGSFLGRFAGHIMPVHEIFVLPWLLLSALYKYFFLTMHYFSSFFPIIQQAGQAVVPGRLSLHMCLWRTVTTHQFSTDVTFQKLQAVEKITTLNCTMYKNRHVKEEKPIRRLSWFTPAHIVPDFLMPARRIRSLPHNPKTRIAAKPSVPSGLVELCVRWFYY